MYDVIGLSNYIVNRFNSKNSPITNLKLQKILYYFQGYSYHFSKKPAFEEEIYCWTYGPVVRSVYYEFSIYGRNDLEEINSKTVTLTAGDEKLFNKIIDECIMLDSFELVEKTHRETPWKEAQKNNIISKESISSFFKIKDPLYLWKN